MLIVRATNKLLRRVGPPTLRDDERSTTLLGQWYATALFWGTQVALLVNETTLLPVLMPLAPAATFERRVGWAIAEVMAAHGALSPIVEEEKRRMQDCRIAKTANRSVVGVMNEFTFLAETYRPDHHQRDLLGIAKRLATTPCGPLYRKNISPDRELAALLRTIAT